MAKWKLLLCAGSALSFMSLPAFAQETRQSGEDGTSATHDIIVTARRSEENLQSVPVAVSVITPEAISAKGVFNPVDLQASTPGLAVTATVSDRANLTYTIRGQGFAFGTLFPAVITYFNEVPIANLTAGQFFDVANVQVLRGPQGVAFGRVTDGGNVMITTQAPKEDFGGYISTKVGNYGLHGFTGAINIPLVEDKVLFRAATDIARRDGFTKNVFNGQRRDNVAYEAYRGALTLRPFDGIENTTTVSYQNTHDNGTAMIVEYLRPGKAAASVAALTGIYAGGYGIDGNGDVVPFQTGLTPWTPANYQASLEAQLAAQQQRGKREISLTSPSFNKRKNLYVVNATTLDVTDNIQIKNIFGYVHEKIDSADNFAALNGALINTCHSACGFGGSDIPFLDVEQISEELRVSGTSLGNRLTWAVGGYLDKQQPAGKFENSTVNVGILQRDGVRYATTKSRAIYGSLEFEVIDNLKLNGGLRYTHDTVSARQATYLSPIPGGEQALFNFLTNPSAAQQPIWNALMGARGFTAPLSAADANIIVANTFAPIPHGECRDYGLGATPAFNSVAGTATCRSDKGSFKSTTWQIGASYQMDNILLYAKASKGYRPGGVNGTSPPGVDPAYRPETDVSIEAGIKADFRFNGMFLRTNLAAYTDRYKGIQKNISFQGPGGIPVSQTANAANARIKGIEFESTFIPTEGVTLAGTYAYTHARYTDATPAPNAAACDSEAPSGQAIGFCLDNKFNGVPKHQWTLSADVVLPVIPLEAGKFSVGGRLYHQSTVQFGDTNILTIGSREPSYTTLDLSANWRDFMGAPLDFGFFMTNVTNKLYRIGINNLSQNASSGVAGSIYAAPRMWGFSAKYRFGGDAD